MKKQHSPVPCHSKRVKTPKPTTREMKERNMLIQSQQLQDCEFFPAEN